MAELVYNGVVQADTWRHVDDGAGIESGDVIVSLERYRESRAQLAAAPNARIGVRVPNTVDARLLRDVVGEVALIALHFPSYRDGRAYSQARILRDQLGFAGQLRATGEVLRDQAFYLKRVGFDAFEVPDRAAGESLLAGFRDFSVTYQAAADEPLAHFRRAP
jgi:uncharacterized protein (DUF934 family)